MRRIHTEVLARFDEMVEAGAAVTDAARQAGLSEATGRRRVRELRSPRRHALLASLRLAHDMAQATPCLANGCPRMAEVPSKGVCHAHYKKLRAHGQYESPGAVVAGQRCCTACGETKAVLEFGLQKAGPGGRSRQCRTCVNAKQKRHNARHRLLKQYGMRPDDYDRLLAEQGGVCAICGTEPTPNRRLAVDHCHEGGQVRGLLCTGCNVAIGHMRDDADRLEAAAAYLRERG